MNEPEEESPKRFGAKEEPKKEDPKQKFKSAFQRERVSRLPAVAQVLLA